MSQHTQPAVSAGGSQPRSVFRLVGSCLVGCAVKSVAEALVRATSGGERR
jgi:hypothetical protein